MIFFYLLDNLQKGMCKNLNVLDNMKNELKIYIYIYIYRRAKKEDIRTEQ